MCALIARQNHPFAQFLVVEVDGEPIGSDRMEDLVVQVNTILTAVDIDRIQKLSKEDKFEIVREVYKLLSSIRLELGYKVTLLVRSLMLKAV